MIVNDAAQREASASADIARLRVGIDERGIGREQAFALCLSLALCASAAFALSVPWARTLVTPSFPFVPIATTWSIFDLLTACFLFARFYFSGRRLFAWVGFAYGCTGLLTIAYLAAYLRSAAPGHHTVGDQQVAGTLYIAWHVLFAVLIPLGLILDRKQHDNLAKDRAHRATWTAIAALFVTATCIAAAAFVWRDHLPRFAINGVMEPTLAHAMLAIVVLSGAALAGVLTLYRRRLYGLPLWLSVALLTSMLEAALNGISPHLFSAAWDLGKLMTLSTASFVMIQTLVATLRMYASISEIMTRRSLDAGARLRAIWQIATSEGLGEPDHLQLILDIATANLRPRHNMFGFTSYAENGAIHIAAVCAYGDPSVHRRASSVYRPGVHVAPDDGIHRQLYSAGKTLIWENPSELPAAGVTGWRSAIGTVVRVDERTHALVFASPDRLETEPFMESDVAFVEVVASVIHRRYFENAQLKRIEFQNEHDALTGAYNRTLFRRLGRNASAAGTLRAVILVNFDAFSEVNHRLGQLGGDNILIEAATALALVDERDVIARINGDEFGILVQSPGAAIRDLQQTFTSYERVFKAVLATGVTASTGIAVADDAESGFEELLSRAAVALEHAKGRGGDALTIFGPELQSLSDQRSLERAELVEALRKDELFLEYQPTFELNTRSITGAEALVRWNHPVRGIVRPATLLPALQRANLLNELTFWVMRKVAHDFGGTPLPEGFRCFFNVPALVLENEAFITNLQQMLFANPELSGHLGIEVTESEVMYNVELAIESLGRARQLGFMVAIDDFGTGYSSLTYLKRLPIDVLKLDKSFIQGLPEDQKDVALAELFLALSKQIGLVSLGEGIETEAQAQWLCSHGCMIGQGFLYSKPISHAALVEFMQTAAWSD